MNNKIRIARAEVRMTQQQLAEAVGGVDDALIAESMEFFYPHVKEGGAVFPPAFAKSRSITSFTSSRSGGNCFSNWMV